MRKPKLRDWSGDTGGTSITDEATPVAEATLLQGAVDAVIELATTPYCACGHLYEGGTTGLEERYAGVTFAPASKHTRVALTNAFSNVTSSSYTPTANMWFTTSGGTTGVNLCKVQVQSQNSRTFPSSTINTYQTEIILSSDFQKDDTSTLTAPADRLGELQEHRAPRVEAVWVKNACGFAMVCSEQSGDLESCPA